MWMQRGQRRVTAAASAAPGWAALRVRRTGSSGGEERLTAHARASRDAFAGWRCGISCVCSLRGVVKGSRSLQGGPYPSLLSRVKISLKHSISGGRGDPLQSDGKADQQLARERLEAPPYLARPSKSQCALPICVRLWNAVLRSAALNRSTLCHAGVLRLRFLSHGPIDDLEWDEKAALGALLCNLAADEGVNILNKPPPPFPAGESVNDVRPKSAEAIRIMQELDGEV